VVSGGHTSLYEVAARGEYRMLGQTRDDAAGEAFDKVASILKLPYPGGPEIEKLAHQGNPSAIRFPRSLLDKHSLNFSFSGLKTNFLYFLRERIKGDPDFIEKNKADLCASLQYTIVTILTDKLVKASGETGIHDVGISGGVSANSALRNAVKAEASKRNWNLFIPDLSLTTDNAAMIGIAGYYKYLRGDFASQDVAPLARY
jgi:N6-L-threonylcarbamoyladenine synthase